MTIERVELAVQELTQVVTDFRVDTAERLGRIEATGEMTSRGLDSLEDRVQEVEVDTEVAKKMGGSSGRRWGAGVGVLIVSIAETVRAWFG